METYILDVISNYVSFLRLPCVAMKMEIPAILKIWTFNETHACLWLGSVAGKLQSKKCLKVYKSMSCMWLESLANKFEFQKDCQNTRVEWKNESLTSYGHTWVAYDREVLQASRSCKFENVRLDCMTSQKGLILELM